MSPDVVGIGELELLPLSLINFVIKKTNMPRNHRDQFTSGNFYHIYNKVVSEAILFQSDNDYTDFMIRYAKYLRGYFDTYAYCLIPNHFHFLVRVKNDVESAIDIEKTNAAKKYLQGEKPLNFVIENQTSRMFSGIALKHNHRNNRIGPLFKEGIKRVKLKTESRVIYQLCYIHHNPIHHNLSMTYKGWKYSSYHSYVDKKIGNNDIQEMIEMIGDIEVFHTIHNNFKIDQAESIFD